ncbi:MAG TPA: ABC transporter substrate-binding protein [Solirubrobacterales bacterium]
MRSLHERPSTRRAFLGSGAAGALAIGLAACGGGGSTSGSGTSAGGGSGTRTVKTAEGPVTVPAEPTRVVSIQPSTADTLYDLGIDPLGVYDLGGQYVSPRYRPKWNKAAKVGDDGEINVEEVAKLEPDLVIGVDYEWNTDVYSKLKEIAPTVIVPATGWREISHATADAVNRLSVLAELQKELATRSAQIRVKYAKQLDEFKWDILQGGFEAGNFWLYGPESDAGEILAGAGVRFASASAAVTGEEPEVLSYEKIGVLDDAGAIGFYSNFDGTPNNEAQALFSQAAFKQLDAAKEERLVPIPDFLPGGYGDALAILDELEAGLKKFQ